MPTAHRLTPLIAGILSLSLLGACSTTTEQNTHSRTQPGAKSASPVTPETSSLSLENGLNDAVLYEILVAEFAGQRGDVDLASEKYLHLAETLKDAALAERATRIMIYARKDAEALSAAKLWTHYEPENSEAQQILAAMYLRNNLPEEALTQIEKILQSDPDQTGNALQMLANFLSREEDKATAMAVMDKLMRTRQDDVKAMFAYGLLTLRAGETDKARQIMERVTELAPEEQNYQMVYLGILEKAQDKHAALEYLENLLEAKPDDFNLKIAHARMLADLGRFEQARDEFKALTLSHPENTDARYALGLLNIQTNQAKEAKKQFEFLIKKNVLVNESSYYMGQIAEFEKDYKAALKWYESIDSRSPQYFDAQIKTALMLSEIEGPAKAQQKLNQIRPVNAAQQMQLVRVMAELLIEEERYDEAMALFDQALQENPNNDLLYSRAMLAEKMGRLDLLERDLRLVLDSDPDNADVLNALGYTLADRTDRYEEAYNLIKRANEIAPGNFYILDSMGWVLYRLGRMDEAIRYLREAQALNPDPEISAHLAEVLWVSGNEPAARQVLQEALKATPEDKKLLDVMKKIKP